MHNNLLPLSPSILNISAIFQPNLAEIVRYGSDHECRIALDSVADQLGDETIDSLAGQIEKLVSEKTDLEYERDDAIENYETELKHGKELHKVSNDLASALIDLMAQVKSLPMPDKLIKSCDEALDRFEAIS